MEIDTNLYSRQIGTFGMEAMSKLIQLNVLIYGQRGLGAEVAKNIILAGPKRVTLFDPEIVSLRDLGSNFNITENDINNKRRDEASLAKLKELNPYVLVDIPANPNTQLEELATQYHVVVITEMLPRKRIEHIDEICRNNKTGLIYSSAVGISGFCFVDFGKEHIIRDENGEECKQYILRTISKDEKGIVIIDDTIGTGKMAFSDGDFVVFKEVQGMTELNDNVPRELKYVSPIAFSIGDTSKYGEYLGGGIAEQVKVPKTSSYKALSESFEDPYNGNKIPDPIDFAKFGRNELLHVAFLALHEFISQKGALPELNNENDAHSVLEIAKHIYTVGKNNKTQWIENSQEFNDEIVLNVARWARSQVAPVTAFLGGVVAQEIVKFTGKYTPIDQWLWFDFFETIAALKNPDRTLLNSRYDDQVAIYGREIQEKLSNLNIFMIGAGALGCEFLKEFALMGISTNKGKFIVTDNDNIEVSNLNRQFLFRRDDVHQSKSKIACNVIRKINSNFNSADLQSRVGAENEHIFDANFWNGQDFIINAVDNVHARKYIDSMCTWYGKPLIDSGTLGTKAHVQLSVPHVTSCYNDTQDPPEESIPMCTLHNFPAMIEHCIEWGRDQFNGLFTDIINDAKKLLADPTVFYSDLKKEGNTTFQLQKLNDIKKLIEVAVSRDFNKCVQISVDKFTENFDHRIQQLLHNFPADYTNPDGSKFWSGSKRVPSPIHFDAEDPLHLTFVASNAILIADALSIKPLNIQGIKEIAAKIKIPEFAPKKIKIKVNENEPEDHSNLGAEEEAQLSTLINELSIYDAKKHDPSIFKPHEFEKDDDTNNHIDFIHAASNLRARNYRISECDRQKTKMIAGKIVPAIATTTAAITGLVALQLYTLLQTNDISLMRGTYMNLAVNLFVLTEPAPKIEHQDKDYDPFLLGPVKALPNKWTVWDKLVLNGPMTFRQILKHFKDTYQVEINIITSGNVTLIQTFQKSAKDRYDLKVEDVYSSISKYPISKHATYLVLEISGDLDDGASALMPLCQYNFR